MKHLDLKIAGMSCNHCVMAVTKQLGQVDGVHANEVKIGSASIEYDEAKTSEPKIALAIESLGYQVVA